MPEDTTCTYADHDLGRAWWEASVRLVGGCSWDELLDAQRHFYALCADAVRSAVVNDAGAQMSAALAQMPHARLTQVEEAYIEVAGLLGLPLTTPPLT